MNLNALWKLVCATGGTPGDVEEREEPQESQVLKESQTAQTPQKKGKNKVGSLQEYEKNNTTADIVRLCHVKYTPTTSRHASVSAHGVAVL